ncbi:MAG: hypothetical protein ACK6DA_05925 [Candidatus Kapaibacterium sp.]
MKTLHIFTEEQSAKNVFETIVPPLLPDGVTLRVYQHQGKQDLEKAIVTAIPSISKIPGSVILITQDQDNEDCKVVKKKIVDLLDNKCVCIYFVRIVCRELESWFLGDLRAIQKAYPRFKHENYINRTDFKNVDAISKPNNYLLIIIPEYSGREKLPKLEASERISKCLDIHNNTSESFNQTLSAIRRLIAS